MWLCGHHVTRVAHCRKPSGPSTALNSAEQGRGLGLGGVSGPLRFQRPQLRLVRWQRVLVRMMTAWGLGRRHCGCAFSAHSHQATVVNPPMHCHSCRSARRFRDAFTLHKSRVRRQGDQPGPYSVHLAGVPEGIGQLLQHGVTAPRLIHVVIGLVWGCDEGAWSRENGYLRARQAARHAWAAPRTKSRHTRAMSLINRSQWMPLRSAKLPDQPLHQLSHPTHSPVPHDAACGVEREAHSDHGGKQRHRPGGKHPVDIMPEHAPVAACGGCGLLPQFTRPPPPLAIPRSLRGSCCRRATL